MYELKQWQQLSIHVFVVGMLMFCTAPRVNAEENVSQQSSFGRSDMDGDGLPDVWETQIFHTDPQKPDTDQDSFDDLREITNDFNPHGTGSLIHTDADQDGLSDRLEVLFGSDPLNADTDADGFQDGKEIATGFSPISTTTTPMKKKVVIHLSTQRLDQTIGGVSIRSFVVSTGKPGMRTPIGSYTILNKRPRAWSRSAGLWMPWWMQFTRRGHGIHELPEWPGGYKEGANHLGKPVSHGCVRLGIGPAKELYDWATVGTQVVVQKD